MVVSFIGAGNLATNLAQALRDNGHSIMWVYSRTIKAATMLADMVAAKPTDDLRDITPGADIYIIAVKDSVLPDIAKQLSNNLTGQLIVHTAGSINIDVIPADRRGVIYPMQTFSKFKRVEFTNIHTFVEANNKKDLKRIKDIAASISKYVHETDSDKRKILHLAAVFACNFANHCEAIAEKILQDNGIDFDVMKPLIKETFDKILTTSPKLAQTGPAIRNDKNVMQMHAELIRQIYGEKNDDSRFEVIYKTLSDSINAL